jgi:hypothetical protein
MDPRNKLFSDLFQDAKDFFPSGLFLNDEYMHCLKLLGLQYKVDNKVLEKCVCRFVTLQESKQTESIANELCEHCVVWSRHPVTKILLPWIGNFLFLQIFVQEKRHTTCLAVSAVIRDLIED